MKSWLSAVVLGLYLNVALYFGVVHHHHDDGCDRDGCPVGEHKDCMACQWQFNAVTVVPTVVPLIVPSVLETPLQTFDFISYSASSFSFSPSRAPPPASA